MPLLHLSEHLSVMTVVVVTAGWMVLLIPFLPWQITQLLPVLHMLILREEASR